MTKVTTLIDASIVEAMEKLGFTISETPTGVYFQHPEPWSRTIFLTGRRFEAWHYNDKPNDSKKALELYLAIEYTERPSLRQWIHWLAAGKIMSVARIIKLIDAYNQRHKEEMLQVADILNEATV